jgi:hypothetical protein
VSWDTHPVNLETQAGAKNRGFFRRVGEANAERDFSPAPLTEIVG